MISQFNFKAVGGAVAALAVVWLVWQWGFCRFYVAPGYMAIITAKSGEALPPGQILAQPGQKGIQEQPLGEGRHFRNPWLYQHQIMPLIAIPPGQVGVVTAKVGADLPSGEFLAEPGQKGIWRQVLGPGKHRLNPYGYQIDIADAVSIPVGYVGVVTSLSGRQTTPDAFAGRGEKGVRQDILQPGLYYINPKELQVDLLEIGVNQVSLQGKTGGEVITKAKWRRRTWRWKACRNGRWPIRRKSGWIIWSSNGCRSRKAMPPVLTAVLAACRKNRLANPPLQRFQPRRPSPCHRRISATC
jgi:hypothetical protein